MADAPIIASMTQAIVSQLYLGATAYALSAPTSEERLAAQSIAAWCANVSEGGLPPPGGFEIPDDTRAYVATLLEGVRFAHQDLDAARVHMINVLKGSPGTPTAQSPEFTMLPDRSGWRRP